MKERKEGRKKGDAKYIIVVGVADGLLGDSDILPQRGFHTVVIKGF